MIFCCIPSNRPAHAGCNEQAWCGVIDLDVLGAVRHHRAIHAPRSCCRAQKRLASNCHTSRNAAAPCNANKGCKWWSGWQIVAKARQAARSCLVARMPRSIQVLACRQWGKGVCVCVLLPALASLCERRRGHTQSDPRPFTYLWPAT